VLFLYVMFARFIIKFSDVWKLPLQCPAVFNSVYACPPIISPCYVSWYRHVVVTLLMDVCFFAERWRVDPLLRVVRQSLTCDY
jgi:hypothetical protein